MKTIPEYLKNLLFTKELVAIYQQFDDENMQLTESVLNGVLNFQFYGLTIYERQAYLTCTKMNKETPTGVGYVVARLPHYMSPCYMVIKLEDRIKAVEAGLDVIHF